jgi:hypothetical protein
MSENIEEKPPTSERLKTTRDGSSQSRFSFPFIKATLFAPGKGRRLYGAALLISLITVIFVALALNNEMKGLASTRPLDVFIFIFVFCCLIASGIFLYPLLAKHFRERILVEERVRNLHRKFQEGYADFHEEVENGKKTSVAFDEVASKNRDFGYLYSVVEQYLKGEDTSKRSNNDQTYAQKKENYLRGLIRVTAIEHIEDSAFGIYSYELPVIICMLSVALGFIVFSLVPFLGTGKITFGTSSINLVWAAGGFVGAYLYSLYPLFQRYTRRDLPPRAFLDYAIKVFLGTSAVAVFGNFYLLEFGNELQFAFAAALGSVPFVVLSQARKRLFSKLKWPGKEETIGSKDVSEISGITYEYSLRLHEEGVMNIQQLALSNSNILSERTMFTKETVADWRNEAILQLLTGNIPLEEFTTNENKNKGKTLYNALQKVGINTVSDLSNFLQCDEDASNNKKKLNNKDENVKDLIKLLGWDESKKEYKLLLTKICDRGEELQGELEASVAIGIESKPNPT